MLVSTRYQTAKDAQQQLHNTVVELNGDVCHIELVGDWVYSIRGTTKLIAGKERKWKDRCVQKDISEMDLKLEPIHLGYINDGNHNAHYLQRKPVRKWKQGLYADYIRIKAHNLDKVRQAILGKHGAVRQLLLSKYFLDMFDGTYPSFYRAYTQVRIFQREAVAFDKHWAFRLIRDDVVPAMRFDQAKPKGEVGLIILEYKGDKVGVCEGEDIRIFKEFEYLTEPFIEAMIHASQR